jgi:hypothetical protein
VVAGDGVVMDDTICIRLTLTEAAVVTMAMLAESDRSDNAVMREHAAHVLRLVADEVEKLNGPQLRAVT